MPSIKSFFQKVDVTAAVAANLLVLSVLGYAAVLQAYSPVAYYRGVQEDGILEWASFWAFALASAVALYGALAQRRATQRLPWFLMAVAVFCLVVAMEEISWGQRVLGYRPPPYFLAQNYQQELNFHNVLSRSLRKLGVTGVIVGFGLLLPILACWPAVKRLFDRLAIVPAPVFLAPSFLVMAIVYTTYPWSHTGEWVELMLGLGFLFGVAIPASRFSGISGGRFRSATGWCVGGWLLALALGAGTAALAWHNTPDPRYLAAAGEELAALQSDLRAGNTRVHCGRHKRLYTLVNQYAQGHLLRGEFAQLRNKGLAPERADYFLDPWNSPYWIRHDCRSRPRRILVYSFGPNRRRDSSKTEVLGDDLSARVIPSDP